MAEAGKVLGSAANTGYSRVAWGRGKLYRATVAGNVYEISTLTHSDRVNYWGTFIDPEAVCFVSGTTCYAIPPFCHQHLGKMSS